MIDLNKCYKCVLLSLFMGCFIAFAERPEEILGATFDLSSLISRWPNNSIVRVKKIQYHVDPSFRDKPLLLRESFLIDKEGVDEDSVWYQEPMIEYEVTKTASNANGVVTALYLCEANMQKTFLEKNSMKPPVFANLCLQLPSQAWTGLDGQVFSVNINSNLKNCTSLPITYYFKKDNLTDIKLKDASIKNRVNYKLPGDSRPIEGREINLELLKKHTYHKLYELNSEADKEQLPIKQPYHINKKLSEGNKIFEDLYKMGIRPALYMLTKERVYDSKGLYVSENLDVLIETRYRHISRFIVCDSVEFVFVKLSKSNDYKIVFPNGKLLDANNKDILKEVAVISESKRYDGEYRILITSEGVGLMVNKEDEICLIGWEKDDYTQDSKLRNSLTRSDQRLIDLMFKFYNTKTVNDLFEWR